MKIGGISEFKCHGCDYQGKHFYRVGEEVPCPECRDPLERRTPPEPPYWKPYTPGYHKQLDQFFHTKDDEVRYAKKHGLADITGEMKAVRQGRSRWKNSK